MKFFLVLVRNSHFSGLLELLDVEFLGAKLVLLSLFIFYSELDSPQLDSVKLLDLVLLKVSFEDTYLQAVLIPERADNKPESVRSFVSSANCVLVRLVDLLLIQIFKVVALY